jgi:transposase
MSNPHNVGIDVSMKRLDVAILPAGARFSVANDDAGWAELVDRLRQFAIAAVGLEPTGGYERGIVRALLAAGLSVRRINPAKLRQFARAHGVLAKNDRLDAHMIATYVALIPTRPVQADPAVERLAEILTMRRQLCDEHVAVINPGQPSRGCHAAPYRQAPFGATAGRYRASRQATRRHGRG